MLCIYVFQVIVDTVKELGFSCHDGGTMITINGPRFSSKAESKIFRILGADVVNMSTVPEVRALQYLFSQYCYQVEQLNDMK